MKDDKALLVRLILSVLLCYGVYTETGPFTTLAFVLVMIAHEMAAALYKGDTSSRGGNTK